MKWAANLKVGTRLIAAFVFVSVIGAVVGAVGIVNMHKVSNAASQLYANQLLGVSYVKDANIELNNVGLAMRNVLLASNAQERNKAQANMERSEAALKADLVKAKPLFDTRDERTALAQFDKIWAAYADKISEFKTLAQNEKFAGDDDISATFLNRQVSDAVNKTDQVLAQLNKLKESEAKQASAGATDLYKRSSMFMLLLVAGSALLGVVLGIVSSHVLLKQLGGEPGYAVQVAQRVAAGDLSVPVEVNGKNERSLLAAMRTMQQQLTGVVSGIKGVAEAIGSGTKQIASGNADLSQRTEEQASSLEETASSMEELTGTVKQNAENARQANQLAASASEVALKGGQVVGEVVTTMGSINESSKKIADIIGVIDGIAFQTNILALNAAVEAARAGEQGRGFAVVASEVRNLAQRSAAAAKEIKQLIGDSVDKVGAGTKLVDQAGTTMEEIVASVKRVTDIMAEITAASQEQSSGIEQVNQAITQMDQVTQQNAALVEEAAAAAESMQEQAQNLTQAVAVFKLDQAAPDALSLHEGTQVQAAVEKPARPAAERRSPNRARNVARLPAKAAKVAPAAPRVKVAAAGGEEQWEEF